MKQECNPMSVELWERYRKRTWFGDEQNVVIIEVDYLRAEVARLNKEVAQLTKELKGN